VNFRRLREIVAGGFVASPQASSHGSTADCPFGDLADRAAPKQYPEVVGFFLFSGTRGTVATFYGGVIFVPPN
jgi:hypothetical protein